jgi:hypothetical protein
MGVPINRGAKLKSQKRNICKAVRDVAVSRAWRKLTLRVRPPDDVFEEGVLWGHQAPSPSRHCSARCVQMCDDSGVISAPTSSIPRKDPEEATTNWTLLAGVYMPQLPHHDDAGVNLVGRHIFLRTCIPQHCAPRSHAPSEKPPPAGHFIPAVRRLFL